MSEFEMKEIPPEMSGKWDVKINREPCDDVSLIEISSQYGTLIYGMRPEGFPGWVFKETGEGGSVTFFHSQINGELFIGLLKENCPNMGDEPVLYIAGGFIQIINKSD